MANQPSHLHASRRIGLGHFSVQASRPFSRRFFGQLDRAPQRPRRVVAPRLTVRLGDLEQFRAVLRLLHFPPAARA